MIIVNILIFINKLNGPIEGYEEEDDHKEALENEDRTEDDAPTEIENAIGELSEIDDETELNNIKEKLKKILPIIKTTYNNMDINNINKYINNLSSILE